MFEQLTQLVQQYGQEVVVNNNAVPNEHNEGVMNEAGNSIFSSLQKMASEGGIEQLAGLLQGNNAQNPENPAVQQITQQLTSSLGEKFGLSSNVSQEVAGSMIPQILGGLVNKVNDPKDSFQITDLIGAITGSGTETSGIMDTISKYGTQFGLDQNADGKLDLNDAIAVTKSSGGISGFLGKLFGK
ncbi:DUF937 domain-containing protein [Flavobacterium sp. IMCC34518]|uniref:DUF937 domain-containing protein n=1 Tax=Flavobacterium sp. IMCC34518 TaxID=3003623 RepID=UPI0022ABD4D2|nr:DUF937 domain-containing protein [Flavobacterium sp. IMCC34518]